MSPSSLSFQFLESVGPVWVLAAIALAFFAIRLYRGRGAAGGGTTALLALRALALFLVLLLLLDPVLSLLTERTVPARIAVLVDGSLSMSVPWPDPENDRETDAGSDAGSELTRADRVAEALVPGRGDLLGRLAASGRVDAYRFGAVLAPLSDRPDATELAPRDDRTDLAAALVDGVGSRRRETGAVVLVTDGGQNVGVDARVEARRLGVPVYAIGVGGEEGVSDLSLFDVTASGVAWLDNEVPVEARLRARGDAPGEVTVYLSEGDAVLDSARVDLPGGGLEREVELRYEPTEEGLHRYRVWTPAREGEISDANNEHLFAVRVLKEKVRVLLVAGRPSFELTFLRRALESDVSLEVDGVVLSLEDLPGELGRRGARFPDAWADLAKYDLVALLDCRASDLPAERAASVARFVRERGGALLVMGDVEAFETASPELADVLPVGAGAGPRRRTGQILPLLTPAGRTHPVTQMESDPGANLARWRELPPLASAPVFLERRPRARVLVQGSIDGAARSELPLITTQESGAGRVLAIAGTPYWRWDLRLWGSGRSGDLFRRFLSRSVRWLVSRDELRQISIRAGKPLFDGAEEVVVEGQVFDDDFRPIEGADVGATVRGPLDSSDPRAREMSLVDLGDGRYRGTLRGLPPGDYEVEGRARLAGADLGGDRSEMSIAPYRMEFENPQPDFELLRRIAQESGGLFLPLAEAGELPGLLDLDPVEQSSAREWPLLGNPLVFLLLLGVLGAEWALRRRRGLP